jgi:DNA polymerase-3 subunit delta'
MAKGDGSLLKDWSGAQILDLQHKLCHDLLAVLAGAQPRFFEPACLPAARSLPALTAWSKALASASRSIEHPFNPGLLQEALLGQAQRALGATR